MLPGRFAGPSADRRMTAAEAGVGAWTWPAPDRWPPRTYCPRPLPNLHGGRGPAPPRRLTAALGMCRRIAGSGLPGYVNMTALARMPRRPARVIALFCTGPFCPRYPVCDGQNIVLAPFFCCDIRSHRAAATCLRRRSGTVPLSSSSPFAFRFGTQPSFSAADNGRGTTGQQRRRWAAGRPS